MGPDYYRAATGSAEHYAAYAKEFEAEQGIGFPLPDDPAASYEVDNSYEFAYDAQAENDGWTSVLMPVDLSRTLPMPRQSSTTPKPNLNRGYKGSP
jgi:hypothetical protein